LGNGAIIPIQYVQALLLSRCTLSRSGSGSQMDQIH
jgi:hypothetical protein